MSLLIDTVYDVLVQIIDDTFAMSPTCISQSFIPGGDRPFVSLCSSRFHDEFDDGGDVYRSTVSPTVKIWYDCLKNGAIHSGGTFISSKSREKRNV